MRNVFQFLAYSTQVNLRTDENKSRAYEVQCDPFVRLVLSKEVLPLAAGCHSSIYCDAE